MCPRTAECSRYRRACGRSVKQFEVGSAQQDEPDAAILQHAAPAGGPRDWQAGLVGNGHDNTDPAFAELNQFGRQQSIRPAPVEAREFGIRRIRMKGAWHDRTYR